GIRRMYYTLRNTFIVWKQFRLRQQSIRKGLLRWKHRHQRQCLEYVLHHWISQVPRVSYRVVTWMRRLREGGWMEAGTPSVMGWAVRLGHLRPETRPSTDPLDPA